MMVGFAARGQDKKRMGLPKARCLKKASVPFLWKKNRSLFLLLSVPTPRGVSQSCKCLPIGRDSVFGGYSERVGIRQNLDGSVSQRAFAPEGRGSTSTLRYMDAAGRRDDGKLCFIKRKSKDLVSNDRIFREKKVSFFEHRERPNENLWTFLRNFSSFLFFLPIFGGNDTRSFPTPAIRRFFLHSFVRANGHAPAHRALSKFAILAFTLHLHPQSVDTVCFACEGMCPFLPSPVKERGVKPSPASH